jgi:hypothetical protein
VLSHVPDLECRVTPELGLQRQVPLLRNRIA